MALGASGTYRQESKMAQQATVLSRSCKLSLVHDQVLVADWPPREKHGRGDDDDEEAEERRMITIRMVMTE